MTKKLIISGHCVDRFTARIEGMGRRESYGPNYVPRDLGIGGGDSIDLKIDLETGKIIGWEKIAEDVIDEHFPKLIED